MTHAIRDGRSSSLQLNNGLSKLSEVRQLVLRARDRDDHAKVFTTQSANHDVLSRRERARDDDYSLP